ncbi:MAG: CPBP family intramembrane metalloprotease [Bradymonadales bacterium]|nr:CPBP family intramembrane metalloprotease [Bradymonadales bacterium]
MEWRTVFVLLVTPVLLTVFYYYGRTNYFRANHMGWTIRTFGVSWPYLDLVPYVYWSAASLVLRIVVPLLLIVFVLRQSPTGYGYRIGGTRRHIPIYLALFVAILPLLYLASLRHSFQEKYPFYADAALGGWHFWGFELCYFLQFLSLEAFFRGFLLFGLERRFGYYAVLIMTIPYCMIHFGKPFSESLAAIGAGLILGTLALRSRSFLLGVFLHYGVALTMDLLAIYQVKHR